MLDDLSLSLYHHESIQSRYNNDAILGVMPSTAMTPATQQHAYEVQAMTQIYENTGGSSGIWENNAGWLSDNDNNNNNNMETPCGFFGVTCNEDSFVTALDLSSNNLVGTLAFPDFAKLLPLLEAVDLSGNPSLTVDFGVKEQEKVYLEDQDSDIRSEQSASLSRLKYLNVSSTNTSQLNGISKIVGAAQSLQSLDISDARIGSVQELQYLSGLTDLYMNSVKLEGASLESFLKSDTPYKPCGSVDDASALYFGSTSCRRTFFSGSRRLQEFPVFESQEETLRVLYRSTQGQDWNRAGNWTDDSVDVCDWHGVVCDQDGNGTIHELILPENNLQGTVSSFLFQHLSNLRNLVVEDNPNLVVDFSGLEVAPDLKELTLSNTATTSLEGISNAVGLTKLDVNGTSVTQETLSEIFALKTLKTLNMGNVDFAQPIPEAIADLSSLVSLRVPNAKLTGSLPTELRFLTDLVVLDLSGNNLQGPLPGVLNQMVQLRVLDLHGQQDLGGPLLAFDGLLSLLQLDLQDCQLTGTIPRSFLSGVKNKFVNLDVNLKGNRLAGTLPAELAFFQSLNINVADNEITDVPEVICIKEGWMNRLMGVYGCDALLCAPGYYSTTGRMISPSTQCKRCLSEQLPFYGSVMCADDVQDNEESAIETTTPTIAPVSLSQRDVLELLYKATGGPITWARRDNWLDESKDICDWYGVSCDDFFHVRILALSYNGLQGTSPAELFQLRYLEHLFLDGNEQLVADLSGIGSMENVSLRSLVLANSATSFATGISKAMYLEVLDLNATRVTNEIIDEVASLSSLQSLNLANTQINSDIPTNIGGLTALRELVAPKSGLKGTIPRSIGLLTRLAVLDLSHNKLSGSLVSSLDNLTDVRVLDLHDQDHLNGGGFQGPLLPLTSLLSISNFDISMNRLSGTLPSTFLSGVVNNAARMEINLSQNLLTGSVPESLKTFSDLYIDLTGNKVSSLPEEFCTKDAWMKGNVGLFGCSAIMCQPATFNRHGKQVYESEPCEACLGGSAVYFGSIACSDTSDVDGITPTPVPSTLRPGLDNKQVCPDGHTCENGGRCVEDHENQGMYLCECNDFSTHRRPFAGSRCQYPANSLCTLEPPYTSFCTNGGTCTELVYAGSKHINCSCPVGFTGQYCQITSAVQAPLIQGEEMDGSSNSNGLEAWQMSIIFVLPILTILVIVTLLSFLRKRTQKDNYVDVGRDSESKRSEESRDPELGIVRVIREEPEENGTSQGDEDGVSTDSSVYTTTTTKQQPMKRVLLPPRKLRGLEPSGNREKDQHAFGEELNDGPTWIATNDETCSDIPTIGDETKSLSPIDETRSEDSVATADAVRLPMGAPPPDAPASEPSNINTTDAVASDGRKSDDETLSTEQNCIDTRGANDFLDTLADPEESSSVNSLSCDDSNFIGDITDQSLVKSASLDDSNFIGDIEELTTGTDSEVSGTNTAAIGVVPPMSCIQDDVVDGF